MATDSGSSALINLPFVGGIEEGTTAAYVDPSQKQSSLVNGNLTKLGAVNKRLGMGLLGTTALPGNLVTAAPTTAVRTSANSRVGLLEFSEDAVYNYSAEKNAVAGVSKMPNVGVTRQGLPGFFDSASPLLCDFSDTLRMAVYMDQPTATPVTSITIYATIYDHVSGALILQPSVISQTTVSSAFYMLFGCFLFNNGQSIAILGCETRSTTPNEYFLVIYDIASNTFGTLQGFSGTGVGSFNIDACPFVGDPAGGFLVCGTGAGGDVDFAYHDGTGAQISVTAVDATPRTGGNVSIYGVYNELVWVGYIIASDTTHWQWTLNTFSGGTAFTPNTGPIALAAPVLKTSVFNPFVGPIARLDATHAWQAFLQSNAANARSYKNGLQVRFDSTGTPTGGVFWPRGLVPIGRPVVNANGDVDLPCYFYLATAAGENNTCYLVRFSDAFADGGLPIAASANRLCNVDNANAIIYTIGCFPWMSCGASGPAPTAATAIQINDSVLEATNFTVEFNYDPSLLFQCSELGDGIHVAAGVPMIFDGTRIFEESFFSFPEAVTEATSAGTLTGAYSYAVLWRRTDSNGNTHTSAPSFAPTPVTLASQEMTLSVPATMMSWYNNYPGTELWLDVYVTAASGSTYYYHGSTRAIGHGSSNFTYVVNANPNTTNPFVYTTGGVLDNVNPPGARFNTAHNQRLWIVDDTGITVWLSQAFQAGAAIGWNEDLTFSLPIGGAITALAEMDANLVIFKTDSIYVVDGDGPAATGQGSDLTTPQKIATDVGALDWRSVVLFPKGLLFQARAGFYLVDRGLNVSFIGKPVEDTLALFPIVTSATLAPSAQQVRFTCSNGTTSISVAYDYLHGAWTTYQYAQLAADIASGTLYGDQFVLVTRDGFLWLEHEPTDIARFLDDDTSGAPHFVPTSITMPSVRVNGAQGIQGYQRVRRVQYFGEPGDSHGISIGIAVNDDPTIRQTGAWSSMQLSSNPYGDQCELHLAGSLNKVESVQITISDTEGSDVTSGEGAIFVSLAIEVIQIGERYRRVPVSARQ